MKNKTNKKTTRRTQTVGQFGGKESKMEITVLKLSY